MCIKIRNDDLYYDNATGARVILKWEDDYRPFDGRWALKNWEYVIDSRGQYIGCMAYNEFMPLGE